MLDIFRKNFFRSLAAKFLHLFVIVLIKKKFICPRNTSNSFDRRFPLKLECRCSEIDPDFLMARIESERLCRNSVNCKESNEKQKDFITPIYF